jgi:hypothetical protein
MAGAVPLQQQKISGPVGIAILVIVILAICAGGYWYLNKPAKIGPQALAMMNQMNKTKPPAAAAPAPGGATPGGYPGASH